MKPIPSILKYMFGSLILGIMSMVITILLPASENVVTQYWLKNISYAFAVFSNIFTILAIWEFMDQKTRADLEEKTEE